MSGIIHSLEDSLLLSRLRDGDKLAFDSLYSKYWLMVYNQSKKRLGQEYLAEEVVQEVFTQFWIRRSKDEIKNLPGYFYIATRNQVFKIQKREQLYFPVEEILDELKGHYDSADSELLYKELYNAYLQLLNKLSPQQKEIYEMKFHENLEVHEIAERLNISQKTVRNQLGRALSRLRSALNLISFLLVIIHIK